jgi:hypothetical protein
LPHLAHGISVTLKWAQVGVGRGVCSMIALHHQRTRYATNMLILSDSPHNWNGRLPVRRNRRRARTMRDQGGLEARAVTVEGVGDENASADDTEERGNCFQHINDPIAQRSDLTARSDTQSKEFRRNPNFESAVTISCNTPCRWSASSSHPSALGHIPLVAGGCVPPHFEQISFSSTMKAPFFDRLDDRGDEN